MCIISLVINLKYLVDSINNYSDDEYNLFLNLIKDTKKREIIKIKDFNVRKRKILGEILLIKLLDSVNINYNDISINKNEFGKPYLDCGVFFNISHSYDYVVCSISKSEIGIDIEMIRDISESVIKHICCVNEIDFIYKSNNINYYGFCFFTLKEAYFKCLGRDLFNIKSVSFDIKDEIVCSDETVDCYQYNFQNYIISVCKKKRNYR